MKQFLIFLCLAFLYNCRSPLLFEDFQELPGEVWENSQIIEFNAEIPDSGFYQISLNLRHTTDYEMTHLWCMVAAKNNQQQILLRDTLGFHIAEKNGRWIGEGDNLKNLTQSFSQNPVYLLPGETIFRIRQGMRIKKLKGIKSIGLKIEKKKELEK